MILLFPPDGVGSDLKDLDLFQTQLEILSNILQDKSINFNLLIKKSPHKNEFTHFNNKFKIFFFQVNFLCVIFKINHKSFITFVSYIIVNKLLNTTKSK